MEKVLLLQLQKKPKEEAVGGENKQTDKQKSVIWEDSKKGGTGSEQSDQAFPSMPENCENLVDEWVGGWVGENKNN